METLVKRVSADQKWLLFLFISFFAILYTVQVVMNHYLFRTYALDYAAYNQAFWDFAHFRVNSNTIMEPPLDNFFQIHPGFTLLLISPLYHIFNPIFGTYSLLIIQNIFILMGGYCVYLLIYRKTENFWIALLAFIHYNIIWGHYSALSADFIEVTFISSMVSAFMLFFDKRKFLLAALTFLFLLVGKENMGIWLFFICILLILLYKDKKARWIAAGFGVLSVVYLVFLFEVAIPYFQDPERPYWGFAYSVLGDSPAEAVKFIVTHPFESLRLLFVNHLNDPDYDNIKKEFYVVFALSGGLLLFRRPVFILPFIPVIAQKMFNDGCLRWGILSFYSIEVVSILTMFVFMATIGLRNIRIKYALYIVLCLSTLMVTLYKLNHRTAFWYDRSKENLLITEFYQSEWDVRKIRKQVRELVPDDAALVSSQCILPHFSQRDKAYMFPYLHDATYMVLLMGSNNYPLSPDAFNSEAEKYLNNPDWEHILDDYPLIILRKKED
jgi:uncharacterized membrane protein